MNIFDTDFQSFKYGWLVFIAFIGGIIGYFRKQAEKDKGKRISGKLFSAFLSVLTSMFVAYIAYELLFYSTGTEKISIALAGLASFLGTDLLVAVEEGLLDAFMAAMRDFIKRIFGGK